MGDAHAHASGLLDGQSGPDEPCRDALSAVLRAVSLTGTCFFVVEATGPWWAEVPSAAAIGSCIVPGAQQLVSYHVVTEGRCWAGLEQGASLWAEAGDIVVIPHGDCYALGNAPGVVGEQPVAVSKAFFRQLAAGLLPPTIRYGDSASPDLRVLCGFLGMRSAAVQSASRALPRHARVPATGGPAPAAWRAWSSSRWRNPGALGGQRRVLLRISELLFVEVDPRHVDALPPGETSWLGGLRDPVVSRALALLHGRAGACLEPALARREAAVSESVLAERFTRLVGSRRSVPHALADAAGVARLLEGKKVASVGLDVGYESEAAFSRAFKNVVGTSPAAWRRRRKAGSRSRLARRTRASRCAPSPGRLPSRTAAPESPCRSRASPPW